MKSPCFGQRIAYAVEKQGIAMGHKVYVDVTAHFSADGTVMPLDITWVDGHVYEIDRVLNICKAASLRGGGLGLRYTCRISGRETHMWLDDYTWYVEAKGEV